MECGRWARALVGCVLIGNLSSVYSVWLSFVTSNLSLICSQRELLYVYGESSNRSTKLKLAIRPREQ